MGIQFNLTFEEEYIINNKMLCFSLLDYVGKNGAKNEGHLGHSLEISLPDKVGEIGSGKYRIGLSNITFEIEFVNKKMYRIILIDEDGTRGEKSELYVSREEGEVVGCDLRLPNTKFTARFGIMTTSQSRQRETLHSLVEI